VKFEKRFLRTACALMALAALSGVTHPAHASTQTVAVFPFELLDSSQEGELMVKVRPEETKRLELLTAELRRRLTESQQFDVISIEPLAADLKAAAPLYKCNGCEGDLAKKTGAKLVMTGLVQKFSDTLLSVNIQVLDAQTGALVKTYSAGAQGNTDEAWLRGVIYITKNKLITQEVAK
jgi:TolB-like protein